MDKKKIIVTALVAALVVGLGFYFLFRSQKNTTEGSETNNTPVSLTRPGIVFSQYDKADKSLWHLKYYSLTDKSSKTLYSIRVNPQQASPVFLKYDADSVLIWRAGDENKDVVISLDGQLKENYFHPGYFPFLFSPSGQKIAFSRTGDEVNEMPQYQLVVRNMLNGYEKSLTTGQNPEGLSQYLKPLRWTADEKIIFAIPQTDSERLPDVLYKIDTLNMTYERDKVVNKEGLVPLTMDGSLNVYGYKKADYEMYGDKKPSEIYEVDTSKGVSIKHPLQQSRIRQLFGVSEDGKYIAYAYSESDQLNDLYVYNLEDNREQRVTNDSVVSDTPYWYENKLAFIENKHSSDKQSNTEKRLQLFDAQTSQLATISNNVESLVGWFE